MRMLRGATAVAVLLVIATPVAADPTIDSAKAAVDASDYLAAKNFLNQALAQGRSGPRDLAEIYRLSGIVAGALGDAKAATEAFQRCLALEPRCTLAAGTSPKIMRPFTAAQDFFKSREPIRIKSETESRPPAVIVVIASDPLTMVAKVQVTAIVDGKPEQTFEGAGTDRIRIELPGGARVDLRIAVLDDMGNRVAELGSKEVPIVIVGNVGKVEINIGTKSPGSPKAFAERPLALQWWMWGGAAVVFGGLGTFFGIDAVLAKRELDDLNADSANHSFDEAKRVEGHARRSVLLANISYGAAGVFAVGAAVLWLTAPRRPVEARPSIAPVVVTGYAGVVVGGRF